MIEVNQTNTTDFNVSNYHFQVISIAAFPEECQEAGSEGPHPWNAKSQPGDEVDFLQALCAVAGTEEDMGVVPSQTKDDGLCRKEVPAPQLNTLPPKVGGASQVG